MAGPEIEYLTSQTERSAALIRAIYKAGYCTPLPSHDEKTNISGSRILSLTSNRRQDFEHAQWELFEKFTRFFNADPSGSDRNLDRDHGLSHCAGA